MRLKSLLPFSKNRSRVWQCRPLTWFRPLSLGMASAFLAALPVDAAEKLFFKYGILSRSLQISSLEAFAEDGAAPLECSSGGLF